MNLKKLAASILILLLLLAAKTNYSIASENALIDEMQEIITAIDTKEKEIEKDKEREYVEGEAIVMYRSDFTGNSVKLNAAGLTAGYSVKKTYEFKGAKIPKSASKSALSSYVENKDTMDFNIAVVKSDSKSTKELLKELSSLDWILSAEPNYTFRATSITTDDTFSKYQWAIFGSGNQGSSASNGVNTFKTKSDREKVVAVLDTGVNYNLADLKNIMWVNPYSSSELKGRYGYDFYNDDSDPMDDIGHGTHCAGIIGAQGNNDEGVSGVTAGAPNIKIMALKGMDSDGNINSAELLGAYSYVSTAQDLGTEVVAISNSFTGYLSDDSNLPNIESSMKTVMDTVGRKGAVSVCAAGNESAKFNSDFKIVTSSSPYYGRVAMPCGVKSDYNLSVAAINQRDNAALFSNYGPSVSFGAPGTEILSTINTPEFTPALYINTSYKSKFYYYQTFDGSKSYKCHNTIGSLSDVKGLLDGVGKAKKWEITVTQSMLDKNYGTVNGYLFFNTSVPTSANLSCTASGTGPVSTGGKSGEGNKRHYSAELLLGVANNTYTKIVDDNSGFSYYGKGVFDVSGDEQSFWVSNGDFTSSNTSNCLCYLVKIYQPGEYTFTIDNIGVLNKGNSSNIVKMNYGYKQGTSMATPHVAGALAVLSNIYENKTPLQRRSILLSKGYRTASNLSGKVQNSRSLDLTKLEIKSIQLSNSVIQLGDTKTLSPIIEPSTASDQSLTWSSNDTRVASVDSNGVVTGNYPGTATITVRTGNYKTATCTVTVTGTGVPVTSVTLNKTTLDLIEGTDAERLIATVNPSNATINTVTWSSSNSNVASVDSNGYVTPVSEGTATITATADDKSATCTVNVTLIRVSSVTLNKASAEIEIEKTLQLNATVLPENASHKEVTWKSSDPNIASVDQTGKVEAKALGTVTITATADGKKATCQIVVKDKYRPVESIWLNKTRIVIDAGEESFLEAIVLPTNATNQEIIWNSEDPDIVTVDEDGIVTGIAEGIGTITATAENKVAECIVTVNEPEVLVTNITLDKDVAFMETGGEIALSATIEPEDATNQIITWFSSNEDVAIVDEDGVVYGMNTGTATITARAGGITASCIVNVLERTTPVRDITLNKSSIELEQGEEYNLIATVKPDNATNKTVTWKSSNNNIAIVDNSGTVIGVSPGNATITATAGDKVATCNVTVIEKVIEVTSISLNKTEIEIDEGDVEILESTVLPLDATDKTIYWTSENNNTAKVNNGIVTGVNQGTTQITAMAGDKVATCNVIVNKKIIPVRGVVLDEGSIVMEEGDTRTLVARVEPEDATDKTIEWRSFNEDVVTVNENGVLRAISKGDTLVMATAGDKFAVCSVEVIVKEIMVTDLLLNEGSLDLEEDEVAKLEVTILPESATDKTVSWSSSNPDVATVNNGIVKAISIGEAIITVETPTGIRAQCNITVRNKYIEVERVTLNKSSLELEEGRVERLYAAIYPYNATNDTITWESADETIATVDENGLVTAVSPGTVLIIASAGDKSAMCMVTVNQIVIPVRSITLNEENISIEEGSTRRLVATISPDNATDKTITWESTNESAAIVENGEITAISEGTTIVKAKAGEKEAVCHVTVTKKVIPVTAVLLSNRMLTLEEQETRTITATVIPYNATNKDVTWTSEDENVAVVDNGNITALRRGVAIIKAEAGGKSTTCEVTVTQRVIPVTSISLNKDNITLEEGETEDLIVNITPSNATDQTVTWTTSDKNVATVTGDRTVTAIGEGTAIITAVSGDKQASCRVTVNKKEISVENIILNTNEINIIEGERKTIIATIVPENATNKTITWTSSDDNIVTVESGTVLGISPGTATITAEADGKTVTCNVVVSQRIVPVEEVRLNSATETIEEGESINLLATVLPENATDKTVRWETSSSNVAVVSGTGTVYGIKEGTAAIIAVAGEKRAVCMVTVTKKIVYIDKITLNKENVSIVEGESISLVATIEPSDATNQNITWTSSNEEIATVNKGIVVGIKPGTVEITAEADGEAATCIVEVTQRIIRPEKVVINKNELTLEEGEEELLNAYVVPQNATYNNIQWASFNESSVKVEQNGLVKALGVGRTPIIAYIPYQDVNSICIVTVVPKVVKATEVTLDKEYAEMELFHTVRLEATIAPEDTTESIVWTSSNEEIAFVSGGLVKGLAIGEATITATVGDVSASCVIKVNKQNIPIYNIALNKKSMEIGVEEQEQLLTMLIPVNATNKAISWISSDTDVVTVDEEGIVKGKSEGRAIVSAITYNGIEKRCEVTVVEREMQFEIYNNIQNRIKIGKENTGVIRLSNIPEEEKKNVKYVSSDDSILEIEKMDNLAGMSDDEGREIIGLKIKGKRVGNARIVIIFEYNGKRYRDEVACAVVENLYELQIEGNDEIRVGDTQKYTAILKYQTSEDQDISDEVTWESSDEDIAKVNNEGKVIGISEGEVEITAIAPDRYEGISDTKTITVIPAAEKRIIDIDIAELPEKLVYIKGYENLDLTGGLLNVTYNDNSELLIGMTDEKVHVNGFDNSIEGDQELTITYEDYVYKEPKFSVRIVEKSVTSMMFEKEPNKKVYSKGEELDLTGGIIDVTYNDESSEKLYLPNSLVEVSGYNKDKIGDQEISLSYGEMTIKYTITVEEPVIIKEVSSIEIKKKPDKLVYKIDEGIDLTGGVILVNYSDDTSEELSMLDEEVRVTGFNSKEAGIKTLTVNYKNKLAIFDVTIKAEKKIVNIAIGTKPLKTEYKYGESLDLSGGKLVIIYDDDTREEIDLTDSNVVVSGYDPNQEGSQTVTIEYQGKKTSINVEVAKKTSSEESKEEETSGGNDNNSNRDDDSDSEDEGNNKSNKKSSSKDSEDEEEYNIDEEDVKDSDSNNSTNQKKKKESVDTGDSIELKVIIFIISTIIIIATSIKQKRK